MDDKSQEVNWFVAFHIKLWLVQNLWLLDLMKCIYILEFMIELGIRFNEIDGFIIIYDRTRYLVLFGSEKDAIYNRIRYLISLKIICL